MATNKFKVYAETPGKNTDATSTVQTDDEFASDNDVKLGAKKQTEVKSRPLNTALREVSLLATSLIDALEEIKPTSNVYSPNETLTVFTSYLKTALLGIVKANQDAKFNITELGATTITTAQIETIVSSLIKSTQPIAINLVDSSNNILGTVSLGDNKVRIKYGNGYIDITNSSVTISDGTKTATISDLVDKVSANNNIITIRQPGRNDQTFTLNQDEDKTITLGGVRTIFEGEASISPTSDPKVTINNINFDQNKQYLIDVCFNSFLIAGGTIYCSQNIGHGVIIDSNGSSYMDPFSILGVRLRLENSGSNAVIRVDSIQATDGSLWGGGSAPALKVLRIKEID